MELLLNNRIALVTGASQGIGREIAIQLAKAGARVAITSNDVAKLEEVANEIKNFNGHVLTIAGDVTYEHDIQQVVNVILKELGRVDILINNVGKVGTIQSFDKISGDEWQELFKINVMSGVNFTQAILPYMKNNGWGRIIFISSEKAIEPGINMSNYAMTKAAMLSLAKSLANEVGKDGITVNSISPGVIVTPAWDESAKAQNLSSTEYASQFCHNVLSGQSLGQPKDVASLACYLCSDAARWITGSNFRVDGGSVKSI